MTEPCRRRMQFERVAVSAAMFRKYRSQSVGRCRSLIRWAMLTCSSSPFSKSPGAARPRDCGEVTPFFLPGGASARLILDHPMDENLAGEVVTDLLRSAWIVEAARADLYARWSGEEARFDGWAERARRRAGIVERSLGARNGKPDRELVAPHSSWIGSLAGAGPGEVPLGDLFTMRLGDWVESHAGPFVEERDELSALGAEDKAEASFPSELPAPPPFKPLAAPALQPPG